MLHSNLESEYISNKDGILIIIDKTSNIIENLISKYLAYSKSEFPPPNTNIVNNFKILEFKWINNENYYLMLNRVLTNADEYLKKLKFRVKDNTLKVLITGDLNSGKSTLINAIFHQNILPTDQQPCTQSFCEVIPSIESLIQPKIIGYKLVSFNSADDGDELSHEQMKEELQNENSSYKWFKISVPISKYITDSSNQMCVSFIDSPGLNTDLFKTTSLVNQQQDIDVVVFVVNASFHLTLSGKEFLEKAAKEKEKIFFVVNKFDEIENFKKCKKLITNQIRQILPETFVDAQNLIHFVSAKRSLLQSIEIDAETVPANEIITNNDDKVTSKETSKFNDDFENMKSSLINFLFTKRSISKLAPAKTFSTRLLQDLYELSSLNLKYFKSESQLTESKLEKARKNVQKQEKDELELKTGLNRIILSSSEACFKNTLSQTVSFSDSVAKILNSPKYPGIWNIRSNLTEKYKRIAQYYSQTMVKIETEALEIKTNGQNEIDSFSDKYEIEIHKRSISLEASKFELIMPLRKPELFDLFDPREIINSFGTLNLTSLVGVFAGIQPCTNLIWKFSQRVGINPLIISALIFGGFGIFTLYATSSSIERAIYAKLANYFASRFNKDMWAIDMAERKKQSVLIELSAKANQVIETHIRVINQNRQSLVETAAGSKELVSQIDYFKQINTQIEILLKSCEEIKL